MLRIETAQHGKIDLRLRPDSAPQTVEYVKQAVRASLYNNGAATFYRSDFVIQCGVHGTGLLHPQGNLSVNETKSGTRLSNKPGTAALAHFDVPDNGNTEFFINLQHNKHLDTAYGGYCVFAEVVDNDSMAVCRVIAKAVKEQRIKPKIVRMGIVETS